MSEIVLKGHKVAKGKAKGMALVTHSPLSFFGGVSMESGIVIDQEHELKGVSITDRILIFPTGKGSTAGTMAIYELACSQKGPGAVINNRTNPVIAAGVIMGNIPTVDRVEPDPLKVIKTGDLVEVDADQGIIRVWPKSG